MKKIIKYIFPKEFMKNNWYWAGLALAMWNTIVLVLQLFTYEKFDLIIESYGYSSIFVGLWIIVIPIIELASIPLLLSMRLSKNKIWKFIAVLSPILWLKFSIMAIIKGDVDNIGIFGATLTTNSAFLTCAISLVWLCATILVVAKLPSRIK